MNRSAASRAPGFLRSTVTSLNRPVDIASLVFLRIAFGLVMIWEVWRYFDHGWISKYWIEPEMNFPYLGFSWITPLPGEGMHYLFAGMGVLALMITLGLAYRLATLLFFLAITYVFLLEQARYLNHFYLACLLALLMALVPAHRCCSVGTRLGRVKPSNTTPLWSVWIFRFQLAVVYFYGGLAKINADWLHGEPMRMWLERRGDMTLIGPLLDSEFTVWLFVYGGLLFDLAVVPLLLWRRTRIPAFILTVLFHLTNAVVWTIGIFPFMAIALTTVFLDPSWPRRIFSLPVYRAEENACPAAQAGLRSDVLLGFLFVYAVGQLLIPFRHFLYPGPVAWTDEGHKFSWRMKLRSRSGTTVFRVTNNTSGETRRINPEHFMTSWQRDKLDTQPDMILQFVRLLEELMAEEGWTDVSIRARSRVSLNGRARQVFLDPDLDLTTVHRSLAHKPWIRPLTEPLPGRSAD